MARRQSAMSCTVSLLIRTITSPALNPAAAPALLLSTERTNTPLFCGTPKKSHNCGLKGSTAIPLRTESDVKFGTSTSGYIRGGSGAAGGTNPMLPTGDSGGRGIAAICFQSPSVTFTSLLCPSRTTVIATVVPGTVEWIALANCSGPVTGLPLNVVTMSPLFRPAWQAGPSWSTPVMTAPLPSFRCSDAAVVGETLSTITPRYAVAWGSPAEGTAPADGTIPIMPAINVVNTSSFATL